MTNQNDNPFLQNNPSTEYDSQLTTNLMKSLLDNLTDEQKTAILQTVMSTAKDNTHDTETQDSPVHDDEIDDSIIDTEDDETDLETITATDTGNHETQDDEDDNLDGLSTFDDMDEEEERDVIIDNGSNGAIRLTDSIITYDVERFINPKTDKPYNRIRLRRENPVLKFKQHKTGTDASQDETVSIILTRPLALKLSELMQDVVKGYAGIPLEDKVKEPFSIDRVKRDLQDAMRYKTAQFVGAIILIIIVLVLGVYGLVMGMQ